MKDPMNRVILIVTIIAIFAWVFFTFVRPDLR